MRLLKKNWIKMRLLEKNWIKMRLLKKKINQNAFVTRIGEFTLLLGKLRIFAGFV